MILKKPQQARRVASGVAVHDLNLIPSVPRTHNGFLLFRARPHDPGSQAAFGRPSGGPCRPPAAVPIPHAEEKKEKDHDP